MTTHARIAAVALGGVLYCGAASLVLQSYLHAQVPVEMQYPPKAPTNLRVVQVGRRASLGSTSSRRRTSGPRTTTASESPC